MGVKQQIRELDAHPFLLISFFFFGCYVTIHGFCLLVHLVHVGKMTQTQKDNEPNQWWWWW